MKQERRTQTILILGLLSAIGPFSIDMYLPGFPAIATDLHTTVDYVSYSLSSFFIGICVGQLICGPLLDRFGRKLPLYVGLSLYIVATFLCALATTVELLVGFRLLQALGCCVGMVAPRAIVRDLFPVNESAKIFSLLILILGVSPIVAPTVGSFLISGFGWEYVFIFTAILTALLLIAVIFLLPESKPSDKSISLRPQPIMSSFIFVLKDPQFFTYGFAGSIASAGLFAYLAGSPFVFMDIYKVTQQQYGWIFGLVAAGLIISSQLNNLVLKTFNSEQIIKTIILVQTTVGLILCIGTAMQWHNLYSTIFLILLFLSCQGFSFPNSAALSLAPFKKQAGTASALMGALQMGFGALASAMVGVFHNNTAVPMTMIMGVCAVLGLVVLLIGQKRVQHKSRIEDVDEQAFEQLENY